MKIRMHSFGLVALLVLAGCTTEPAPLSVEPAAGTSTASDDPTARMENCKSKLHEALDRATEARLAKLGARRDELSKLSADQADRGDDLDPEVYRRILRALEATKAEIAATKANLAALAQEGLQHVSSRFKKTHPPRLEDACYARVLCLRCARSPRFLLH
jgi:hypothetical protein